MQIKQQKELKDNDVIIYQGSAHKYLEPWTKSLVNIVKNTEEDREFYTKNKPLGLTLVDTNLDLSESFLPYFDGYDGFNLFDYDLTDKSLLEFSEYLVEYNLILKIN